MSQTAPYLSLVATTRNDDHGGNLLGRTQTFVNAFISQCQQHDLEAELVLVDWNPPPEREPLARALRWPAHTGPCQVRIIGVPSAVHRRYRHAEALPLYQMIAKNVGIRRARGQFILATNIDILFSEELARFLAERRLQERRMYRIDRHDVMSDVPVDTSLGERLAYCESHLLRVHVRGATVDLRPAAALEPAPAAEPETATPPLEPATAEPDQPAAPLEAAVGFGTGWLAPERFFGQTFRWAGEEAELRTVWTDQPRALAFEMEPGPWMRHAGSTLQIRNGTGEVVGEVLLRGRSIVRLRPPQPAQSSEALLLRAIRRHPPALGEHREAAWRVFRSWWEEFPRGAAQATAGPQPCRLNASPLGLWAKAARRLAAVKAVLGSPTALWRHFKRHGALGIGIPLSHWVLRKLRLCTDGSGLAVRWVLRHAEVSQPPAPGPTPAPAPESAQPLTLSPEPAPVEPPAEIHPDPSPNLMHLHTNGCGDFTLMARQHWHDLRGNPEFDMYSFNLDSVLCYAAYHAGLEEDVLPEPMRIYHIEHASGWTPENQERLFERLRANGIPWLEWTELVSMVETMHRVGAPLIFNHEDWGLASEQFCETVLPASNLAR